MRKKRTLSLLVCTALLMTGCSNGAVESIKEVPLEAQMSIQEVADYYASKYSYDIVTRSKENVAGYEFSDVTGNVKDELTSLVLEVNQLLHEMKYDDIQIDETLPMWMDESLYGYIKLYIDNYNLSSDAVIKGVKGAVGYYYVDVEYPYTYRKTYGKIKDRAELVGIHGAYHKDVLGNDEIDDNFLAAAAKTVNNKLGYQVMQYDNVSKTFKLLELDEESTTEYVQDENSVTSEITKELEESETGELESSDELESSEGETSEELENVGEDSSEEKVAVESIAQIVQGSSKENTVSEEGYIEVNKEGLRKLPFDLKLFNSIVGYSSTVMVYMPDINEVFEPGYSEDYISGMGIVPNGRMGFERAGLNLDEASGKLTIRYVFKETVDGSGDISLNNMYILSDEANLNLNLAESDVVPTFLKTEIDKLVERADRANVDFMLSSLLNSSIYSDIGFGILRGYEYNCSNVLRNMSTVRNIFNRTALSTDYVVEIETTRIEGAKSADTYGQYRDKYYLYVVQNGDSFYIVDYIRFGRELVEEPQLKLDSAVTKRLVSLNLASEVREETKEEANKLLDELYSAGTARVLRGPKDIVVDGQTVHIERGIEDCFTNNSELLSETKREYMNSSVRTVLVKMGTNVGAKYTGNVTRWLGGTDNQVELETEELVEYSGMNKGTYLRVYYLVSCINDKWTIDERTVLEETDVEGTELDNIKSRIK